MIYKRLKHIAVNRRSTLRSWSNKMDNIPVFILGNAPSLSDQPIYLLEPYFTIGINRSFRMLDTTILIWQDIELWSTERKILPKLNAIKYSRNVADPDNIAYHFRLSTGHYKIPIDANILHGRGSSGPLAFQLACLLGANPIVFLGYDCQYRGGKTDFWGKNRFHKSHTLRNCSRGQTWIKEINEKQTKKHIINCSDTDAFGERRSLVDVVSEVKSKYDGIGREYFYKKLFDIKELKKK